jgi:Ni/Co efflux regulator RcnB
MRRLILTTLALSFLAVPAALADTRPSTSLDAAHHARAVHSKIVVKEAAGHRVIRKTTIVKPYWKAGKRVPVWQRNVVRDYRHYGLRRPAYGQQWIRVGDQLLLIKSRSGVVVRVIIR